MEYYDNNLYKYLKDREIGMPINLIKKIYKQLNITFKELLKNHIAHRDIKPHNILIKYVNEYKTNFDSVLADFGVSKKYNEEYGKQKFIGTPWYMAPEILKEEIYYNNCDLYSIGVTLSVIF